MDQLDRLSRLKPPRDVMAGRTGVTIVNAQARFMKQMRRVMTDPQLAPIVAEAMRDANDALGFGR